MERNPASKKAKLALSDVHSVLQRQNEPSGCGGEGGGDVMGQYEVEEDAQIQSSLPHYLNCIFGVLQSNSPERSGVCKSASSSSQLPILNSQGFLFNASDIPPANMNIASLNTPPCNRESQHSTADQFSVSPVLFDSPQKSPSPHGLDETHPSTSACIPPVLAIDQKPATSCHQKSRKSRKRKRSLSSEGYVCPPCCTKLVDCNQLKENVSIFVMVLQVHPVMEVACKTGTMAGRTVQMSSLLLADPSKPYFKLSLWREAAAWVERIAAGDILLLKNIKLKKWRKEVVGHTVMHTSVLNIHQPKKQLPDKVCESIPAASVDAFLQWGRRYYGYLFESGTPTPKSQKPVKFVTSGDFGHCSTIHFRGRLLSVISSGVVVVSDEPGKDIYLYLLSKEGKLWHNQLKDGVGKAWEFLYVAVSQEATQGSFALQTTSRSQLNVLREGSEMAVDILKAFPADTCGTLGSIIIQDQALESIILQKASGIFQLKARLTSVCFLLSNGSKLSLDCLSCRSNLEVVQCLHEAVYVGCEDCSHQLEQDENGVYCQCMACMKDNPGGFPTSVFYFRPLLVTLCAASCSVDVIATYTVVPKLLGTSPSDVVKACLSQLDEMCDSISKTVLEHIQALSSEANGKRWTVNCAAAKDENSYLQTLSLSLLDINNEI